MFSRRTDWDLQENPFIETFKKLRAQGADILDLTVSNPTVCGFNYTAKALCAALDNTQNLNYQPSSLGQQITREILATHLSAKGMEACAERLLLTSSTSEAYAVLFRLLLNPDEKVLIPQPSYPLFQFLLQLNDARWETYPLVYDNDRWHIDLNELQNVIDGSTRAIVLVNPNNPTGSYVSGRERDELNRICRQHNLAIISDEVFFDYPIDDRKDKISFAANSDVLTFSLGGLSKSMALPQMKLSWILANGPQTMLKDALARLDVILDTYLSVNTPVQNALPMWLNQEDVIQKEIRSRLVHNFAMLCRLAQGSQVKVRVVEGGWYAVISVPETHTEEEWAQALLEKDHVFVHPGYFFDFIEEGFMVLSLLAQSDRFEEGIRRLIQRVSIQQA